MATDAAPESPSPAPAAAQSVIVPPNPAQPRKLSEELAMILREFEVETVTLREVLGLLQGRGFVLLVMLLALPFCTPVPLPGVSTPFGLIIGIIGARLACGAKPWLPSRLLDTRLSPKIFGKVFALTRKIILGFERLLRPRMLWVTSTPLRRQVHAIPIVLCAALLLLPLPIPFSNTIPAWSILLMAGGLLERDGGFIIAAYITSLLAVAFFGAIAIFGVEAVDSLWKWLQ
jgi:hypothetical protein